MIVGVTGGFGYGKSTVARLLAARLCGRYLDSDRIAREQLEPGQRGYALFLERFGASYLRSDSTVDRDRLRNDVFGSTELKKRLESLLHPLVAGEIDKAIRWSRSSMVPLVIEVPLLYEVGWENRFDWVVAVAGNSVAAMRRVELRSGLTPQETQAIGASQLDPEEKRRKADYVVDNSGLISSTAVQVGYIAGCMTDDELLT